MGEDGAGGEAVVEAHLDPAADDVVVLEAGEGFRGEVGVGRIVNAERLAPALAVGLDRGEVGVEG